MRKVLFGKKRICELKDAEKGPGRCYVVNVLTTQVWKSEFGPISHVRIKGEN